MSSMTEPRPEAVHGFDTDDDDADAILAELQAETDDINSAIYQKRLNELQANSSNSTASKTSGFPTATLKRDLYVDLSSDDETLRFTTEHEKAVVHFRHTDFARCAIMDQHLDRIAQRHSSGEASGEEVAFAKVDVTKCPFVVEKLGVRVLPCVIGFSKGIVKGKVIGFEGICWNSKESNVEVAVSLEATLFSWGLLKQKLLMDDYDSDSDGSRNDDKEDSRSLHARRGIKGSKQRVVDVNDDWD